MKSIKYLVIILFSTLLISCDENTDNPNLEEVQFSFRKMDIANSRVVFKKMFQKHLFQSKTLEMKSYMI